jgi:hypothetical protein
MSEGHDIIPIRRILGDIPSTDSADFPNESETDPVEFEWYHAMSAFLELPDARRRHVANQLAAFSDNNLYAAGLLYGYVKINEVDDLPAAIYQSTLRLTDGYEDTAVYVPKEAIADDLESRYDIEFKPFIPSLSSKGEKLDFPAIFLQSRALITERLGSGRLGSGYFRLVNPLRIIAMERDLITIPESIRSAIPEIQQAYKLYRVIAPGPNGEGKVPKWELESMLKATNHALLDDPNNSINQERRFSSVDYYRAAIETINRLGRHPLFEVTGGFLKEKWIGLRQPQLEQDSQT